MIFSSSLSYSDRIQTLIQRLDVEQAHYTEFSTRGRNGLPHKYHCLPWLILHYFLTLDSERHLMVTETKISLIHKHHVDIVNWRYLIDLKGMRTETRAQSATCITHS